MAWRFNRIFWKMFAVIWLANSLVIVAMGYLMVHHRMQSQLEARHQQKVQSLAQFIIHRYEQQRLLAVNVARLKKRFELPRDFYLAIADAQGANLFTVNSTPKMPAHTFTLALEGDDGRQYHVVFGHKPIPRFVRAAATEMLSVQLLVLLLVAAVVSGFLSWQLVRPIKKLALAGRSYRVGTNAQAALIEAPLLNRGDELGDLARAMATMFAQTQQAFKVQQQLLHDVSHELRAPLARLQVAASLVEREQPSSPYALKIHAECDRLNALIQQILDYARIDHATITTTKTALAGAGEWVLQPVDVSGVVAELVHNAQFEYPERAITGHYPKGAAKVMAAPALLASALENLIRNACKHTPAATPVDVTVVFDGAAKQWQVLVRDYGKGINESEAEALLRPFYRAGQQMHTQGFGLGLSIAARALEKQQGTLQLQNHPRGGLVAKVGLLAA